MPRILVATNGGVRSFGSDGAEDPMTFEGRDVTAIMRDGPQLWALLDGRELWHAPESEPRLVAALDGAETATCFAMTDAVHVGTEGARLFRLVGDTALEPLAGFDDAPGRDSWYTPWGGPPATRSISEWDENVYVNVHVGGILHTTDAGASWTPTIDIDADVHQVATAEGLVLAACAGGLATSTDRGATWTIRDEGLDAPYARAVVVCGDGVLVSASTGPRGGRAAVYRGGLTGGAFERCTEGLPPWFEDNIDTFWLDSPPNGDLAAFATSAGSLYASEDAGASWNEIAAGLPAVRHVLVVP